MFRYYITCSVITCTACSVITLQSVPLLHVKSVPLLHVQRVPLHVQRVLQRNPCLIACDLYLLANYECNILHRHGLIPAVRHSRIV